MLTIPADLGPLLSGEPPAAPDWFTRALRDAPERGSITVQGAEIETLAWGRRGNPVLLLLHGKGAHADWWSFIAPFFSAEFRVVALSWSGMGRSDWRDDYDPAILTEEAVQALRAGGAGSGAVRPVIVAHSFGTLIALRLFERLGAGVRSVVLIDPPIFSPETAGERRARWSDTAPKAHRYYDTLEEALSRFRFAPQQPCDNLFIADHIARGSVALVEEEAGSGWRWRFDPRHWTPHRQVDAHTLPPGSESRFSVIVGENSALYSESDRAYLRGVCKGGARLVSIPEAAHHVMVDQPIALVSVLRTLFAGMPRD